MLQAEHPAAASATAVPGLCISPTNRVAMTLVMRDIRLGDTREGDPPDTSEGGDDPGDQFGIIPVHVVSGVFRDNVHAVR